MELSGTNSLVPIQLKYMKTIFISAGHSSTDPGAAANGLTEAQVVLEFRDLVAFYLEQKGATFGRDGRKGENFPLSQAAALAKQYDIAVEFHLNAGPVTATGVETLSATKGYAFASKLCSVVEDTLSIPNRGAKPENSGQHSRLAFVQAGGIILELFFLTNKEDLRKYQEKKWLLAKAVANALMEA